MTTKARQAVHALREAPGEEDVMMRVEARQASNEAGQVRQGGSDEKLQDAWLALHSEWEEEKDQE